MKRTFVFAAWCLVAGCGSTAQFQYPVSRTVEQVDVYHGREIADPYRWLEELESEETRAWIAAQNEVTHGYLGSLAARAPIRRRLERVWNYERMSPPRREGGRYFFTRNNGLQNQSVLFTSETPGGEAFPILDPNTLSEDGTVALAGYYPSPDGRYLCYELSRGGSDWREMRVLEVESEVVLDDRLEWVKFSDASWTADGEGFFYTRYPQPPAGEEMTAITKDARIYYHRVGTPQSEDQLVWERPDHPEWFLGHDVTDDGRFLLLYAWGGATSSNALFYRDLSTPDAPVVDLYKDFDARYEVIDNDGPVFWIFTDSGAPRGRIVAVDTREPGSWRELVPEQRKATLRDAYVVGDRFVLHYLELAHSVVRLFALDGKPAGEVPLPTLGSIWRMGGKRADRELFFTFSGYTQPASVLRYDFATAELRAFHQPKVEFDPARFVTKQQVYLGKDGQTISIFITHRKGLKLRGKSPTLLYGYGGFGVALTPYFSPEILVWLEMGGVYAVPNLRGGGEYGEKWHEAGMRERKQTVFDDFIAAAEALVANGYTNPGKLAIAGGSNGGLLVGAVLNQRPDLFGAALPSVGVMDMLRFHRFSAGRAWVREYGSPDDPEQFEALAAYSPYHNIRAGERYPATLVLTGERDNRVVPSHSFKYAAALQAAQGGPAPILIRVETAAGHGAGTPTAKRIDAAADRWAFLAQALGMKTPW